MILQPLSETSFPSQGSSNVDDPLAQIEYQIHSLFDWCF